MGTCPRRSTHRGYFSPAQIWLLMHKIQQPPTRHSSASPGLPDNFPTFKLIRAFNTNSGGVNAQTDSRKKKKGIFLIREKIRDR